MHGFSRWALVGLALVVSQTVRATAPDVDWPRLLAGEVIATAVKNPAGVRGVRALFTVMASRNRIWSILTDYAQFPKLFPGIQSLRVLEQDAHGATVAYHTPVAFIDFRYVLYRRYVEPGRRLTWTRLSGSFKSIDGGWEIRESPRPGVYLLVYESYVNIGRLVPTQLVQRGALKRAQEMGLRLRAWIEDHDRTE